MVGAEASARIESSRRIACRRIGGIAALIAEADRYLLATFYQENLNRTLWCGLSR